MSRKSVQQKKYLQPVSYISKYDIQKKKKVYHNVVGFFYNCITKCFFP